MVKKMPTGGFRYALDMGPEAGRVGTARR
jgi:hypothetical protein